jgi:hypothetical protein
MRFLYYRFRATLYLSLIGVLAATIHIIFDVDVFERFAGFIRYYEAYDVDELVLFFPLLLMGLIIDSVNERNRKTDEIAQQRLNTLKATMTTVQDINNNFLNNMQYFVMEARENKQLKDESIEMINTMIFDTAKELQLLGNIEHTNEHEYSAGVKGIDYKQMQDKAE